MNKKSAVVKLIEAGYGEDIRQGALIVNSKNIISLLVEGGYKKISVEDVIKYYRYEAPNIESGCRTIASISGDWRPIDNIAKFCLEIFKIINTKDLRKIGKLYGMTAKF